MSNNYTSALGVSGGGVQPTGNAQPTDVLSGKTFSNAEGIDKTGTMVNNGAVSQTLSGGQSYTIPAGYHNGSGVVTASAGSYDTSFVPTKDPSNSAIAGTNFTVGKYYIIVSSSSYASQNISGATMIKQLDISGDGKQLLWFVEAIATTISVGNHVETTATAMGLEMTF